jgi:subtilisin family serine protease
MNKKLAFIPLGILLALSLGFFQFPKFFPKQTSEGAAQSANEPGVLTPVASQGPATPPTASTLNPAASLPSPVVAASSIRSESLPLLEAVLNQPVSIEHGGALRELALAKDELYVRNADGIGRVVSIPPASNASELLGQIEKLHKETGSAPELILYPPSAVRDDSTRRIVTRDILIEADSRSAADSLASGLSFKSAPVYAKGKFIYEAPSSPEALVFFVKTADSASPYVTPLLASKVAKMTMPNDPLVQKQWHLKFQNQLGAVSGTDVNVESVWKYPKTKAFVYSGNATIDLTRATTDHIRGGNVTIGIVDDGMEWSHPDLLPNVLKKIQKDWNGKDNDPKPGPEYNSYGYIKNYDSHGTACAGVAAARGNNRIGVSGVAPEANLVGMRLIAGPQTDADIAEAMTWFANEESFADTNGNGKWDEDEPFVDKNRNGAWDNDVIHIKSNSWGYLAFETDSDGVFLRWNKMRGSGPLTEAALEYAAKFGRGGKGSIITFAAGNDGELKLTENGTVTVEDSGARVDFQPLPNSIYTIAVGAVNSLGKKSNYSQIGSSLLISAPSNTSDDTGLGIMTTDNKGPSGYNYGVHNSLFIWPPVDDFKGSGDVTQTFGGTSSATPAVSGVIALMLQRNPNLGWRDVQEILITSAKKIDENDIGWSDNDAGFHFNYKYGAGLVDAAEAVAQSGNWTNLAPQKSYSTPTNDPLPRDIAPGEEFTTTFEVNSANLRAEHVTLQLSVTEIPKGNLTIELTSPKGTKSVFCEPHHDTRNQFENWKFMTVRNWGESSNGTWTLIITNSGPITGNLTNAELVVYGTDPTATESPEAMAATSTYKVFAGANITLSATTSNLTANGTDGSVTFSANLAELGTGTKSSNSTTPVYEYTWNTANFTGNYLVTANVTSGDGVPMVTAPIAIQVDPYPIAAWDFDTPTNSKIPLATAVSSIRKYAANFGSGNLTFNGEFTNGNSSNRWDTSQGEIFSGYGTDENTAGEMVADTLSNTALMLRAGKNFGAKDKSLVFEFSMAGQGNLTVSYAVNTQPLHIPLKDDDRDGNYDKVSGGFTTHEWFWSSNGTVWTPLQTVTPAWGNSTITLNEITDLNNSTLSYLRLRVGGSTAVSGQNLIDNIIFSATPIGGAGGGGGGGVGPTNAKSEAPSDSSPASTAGAPSNGSSSSSSPAKPDSTIPNTSDTLDWKLAGNLPHQMLVHAEVVDGARFVNSSGSVLAAFRDQSVSGLADANPAKTSYLLAISSANSQGDEMRLRVYDAETKNIFALQGNVTFAKDSTLGTPSQPLRLRTAYPESEQKIPVKVGWNSFVPVLSPDPATVKSILAGYDASEGDRLVGPSGQSVYSNGAWVPPTYEIQHGKSYSLLRGKSSPAEITLRGNANPPAMPATLPKAKQESPSVGTPAPSNPGAGGGGSSAAPSPQSGNSSPNKKFKSSKAKSSKTKASSKSKKSR